MEDECDLQVKTIIKGLGRPYYQTELGAAYRATSLRLLKKIPDNSIDLIFTSPPFALTRKKEYGNVSASNYVNWFKSFSKEFRRILKKEGSLVIDIGSAWNPGTPTKSLYQYKLLIALVNQKYHFCQDFFWYNPAKLPSPAEWVNVRRIRVKDSVNYVWWLSKTDFPKADNRKILKEYSKSMMDLLENGYKAKLRPSGHDISEKFSKDNSGAIPPNLLQIANTESNSYYLKRCKEESIKPHPARFPPQFAEFFIKFLTDEGDVVLDPFAGSNVTGWVAQGLKRSWISIERVEEYVKGSKLRFEEPNTYQPSENGKLDDAQNGSLENYLEWKIANKGKR